MQTEPKTEMYEFRPILVGIEWVRELNLQLHLYFKNLIPYATKTEGMYSISIARRWYNWLEIPILYSRYKPNPIFSIIIKVFPEYIKLPKVIQYFLDKEYNNLDIKSISIYACIKAIFENISKNFIEITKGNVNDELIYWLSNLTSLLSSKGNVELKLIDASFDFDRMWLFIFATPYRWVKLI